MIKKPLILFLASLLSVGATSPDDVISSGLALSVSQRSLDTIIYYEVGTRADFERECAKPEVPAWQSTMSGVTIGFGFDCGWNTPAEINKALKGVVSDENIKLLQSVSGLKRKSSSLNIESLNVQKQAM